MKNDNYIKPVALQKRKLKKSYVCFKVVYKGADIHSN